jgi:SAM-dependent methyltransferase
MPESTMIPCPACGSAATILWQVKSNDAGRFLIRKCRSCRSAFVWPRPRPEEIDAFYRGTRYKNLSTGDFRRLEQTYYPDAAMDASRMVSHCRRLARGPRLMDVGAGFGEFTKAARDAGFEVTACEPNANSRRLFQEINGFEPIPDMFDEALALEYAGRFDIALVSHVLEHVTDPALFATNLGTILAPDGIVAVAVPHFGSLLSRLQGKNDMFISPPEHLNFFSRRGLAALFDRNGFRAISIMTVSKLNRTKIRDAGRGAFRGDWAWKGAFGAMRITDYLRLGTVMNAYLRKASRDATATPGGGD